MPTSSLKPWLPQHRQGFAYLFSVILLLVIGLPPSLGFATQPQGSYYQKRKIPDTPLVYVSDYFSFIGQDDQGHVAFALDNNRGRDRESYQAEHFVVLHDERQGWVKMRGNGSYDIRSKDLTAIPDSSTFQFQGNPASGITITSQSNDLRLTISPISQSLYRDHDGGEIWMGSASATFQWADRMLKGRVIYEYLMIPDFNRLSRTYWRLWKEFQGFYLSLNGAGDLYVHRQYSEMLTPLIGELDGFLSIKEENEPFQILQLTPLDFSQGLGFYQWPMKWSIRWVTARGGGEVQLTLSQFNRIATWVIGGFAMGIVQGEMTYQGQSFPVYGLVELIM